MADAMMDQLIQTQTAEMLDLFENMDMENMDPVERECASSLVLRLRAQLSRSSNTETVCGTRSKCVPPAAPYPHCTPDAAFIEEYARSQFEQVQQTLLATTRHTLLTKLAKVEQLELEQPDTSRHYTLMITQAVTVLGTADKTAIVAKIEEKNDGLEVDAELVDLMLFKAVSSGALERGDDNERRTFRVPAGRRTLAQLPEVLQGSTAPSDWLAQLYHLISCQSTAGDKGFLSLLNMPGVDLFRAATPKTELRSHIGETCAPGTVGQELACAAARGCRVAVLRALVNHGVDLAEVGHGRTPAQRWATALEHVQSPEVITFIGETCGGAALRAKEDGPNGQSAMDILCSGLYGELGPNGEYNKKHLQALLDVDDDTPPLLQSLSRLSLAKGMGDPTSPLSQISLDMLMSCAAKLPERATYKQVWRWWDSTQPACTLTAIVTRPELNSQQGHIVGFDETSGHYRVRLEDQQVLNFLPKNVALSTGSAVILGPTVTMQLTAAAFNGKAATVVSSAAAGNDRCTVTVSGGKTCNIKLDKMLLACFVKEEPAVSSSTGHSGLDSILKGMHDVLQLSGKEACSDISPLVKKLGKKLRVCQEKEKQRMIARGLPAMYWESAKETDNNTLKNIAKVGRHILVVQPDPNGGLGTNAEMGLISPAYTIGNSSRGDLPVELV